MRYRQVKRSQRLYLKPVKILDFQMYLDDLDSLKLGVNGIYEPQETLLIQELVKPDWTCIDIGANIGYFTLIMAKKCKHVYAFEPELNNFNLLKQNMALNKFGDVTIYREAVGDYTGTKPLYICDNNNGMHRLYKSKHCGTRVAYVYTVQLDDYKFPKVDFIKMDVEGAEHGALTGMVELLIKDKPTILMEFHPPSIKEYGVNPLDVYRFIYKLGYEIYLIPNVTDIISYEQLLESTNNINGGQNVLCIPK